MTTTTMAQLMAEEQRAAGALRVARAAHQQAQGAMTVALMPRALALQEAVNNGSEFEHEDFEDLRRLSPRDHLEYWELEGDSLRATFRGSFRGECYDNDVRLPSWLLADDWQARLAQELATRRARLQATALEQSRQREADERALLRELQTKYGHQA